MAKSKDPYDLQISPEVKDLINRRIHVQLQDGLDAKSAVDSEVDYWWMLYEQARTRSGGAAPWPGAADLTSHIGTEAVDSMHARLMQAVWADPVCTVEGWADAADRVPFVEGFHQWKAEEERLQSVLDKLALISLVEPRGLLEVAEGTETRTSRRDITAKVQLDPMTGGPIFDEQANPVLERDDQGQLIEAGPNDLSAPTTMDETKRVRTGPIYRILPYKDSVILPGHARDESEIYAYGKKFWKRLPDLKAQADAGIYDEDAVDKIVQGNERLPEANLVRSGMSVAPEAADNAQIELWEMLVLLDIHEMCESYGVQPPAGKAGQALDGSRWYLITLHQGTQQILRIQHDHFERSRFVLVNLFPRADRVTEGYSLIGHKLITTIEEHTAWRNLTADKAHVALNAPLKVMQGALWNPTEQPWGPGQTITVRDPREIEPMVVPDVTQVGLEHIQMLERNGQRLSGVNDVASGQVSQQDRTLGEIKMATAQSFVRIDLMVRRFQEAMEDLYEIRHSIWKRVLAEQPEGVAAPQSLVAGLEGRGVSIDQFLPNGKVMATMLNGAFRFKPHGSVETADLEAMRNNFIGALQGLQPLLQAFPMLIPKFQSPQAAYAMCRQFLRVFRIPNQQAFLGTPEQDQIATQLANMMSQQQFQQGIPGMMGMGGMLPPGPPGMPMSGAGQPAMGGMPGGPSPMGPPPGGSMMPPPNMGGAPGMLQ